MTVGMEELQKSLKGGNIMSLKRLTTVKEGTIKDTETVLLDI